MPGGGGNQSSIFFYLADDATDEEAETAAGLLAGLCNGELVSLTKQIFEGDTVGPWPSAADNGGSDRARILCRNSDGETESITLPLLKHTTEKQEIETVLETLANGFQNRQGNPLGQVVNIQQSQVVDA